MEQEDWGCKFTEEDEKYGHAAFEWTRSEITKSNRRFLSELYFGQRITDTKQEHCSWFMVALAAQGNTSWNPPMISYYLNALHRAIAMSQYAGTLIFKKIQGTMRVTELGLKDQIQKDIYIAKGASPKEVVLTLNY